jgi:multiple sugar transport system substrate-binding protein
MFKSKLSRRDFLKMASASAGSLATGGALMQLGAARIAAAPANQETVTISFMGWGDVVEDEGVRAAIDVFHEEQSAVQVQWLHTPDNYSETLLSNIAAGTPPDTAFISQRDYLTYVHDGLTLDITDYVTNDDLLGQEGYFIEPQETNRSADLNGRWHGVGSTWTVYNVYYNIAAFEEAGITPPGFGEDEIYDWDTFVDVARQLTIDANGNHPGDDGFDVDNVEQWGVLWPMDWWMPIHAAAIINGGNLSEDGLLTLDTPAAMEAIQRIADLTFVHQVMPQGVMLQSLGMSPTQMLDNRRLAMAIDGSWALASMVSMETKPGVGALPQMTTIAGSAQGHLHSVLAASDQPDSAWQWLRFLATPFYETHFCRIGLWIPNQTALLTEDGLATWLNEDIHPANYRQFVTEYVPAYMQPVPVPAGWPLAEEIVFPTLQSVMNGTERAEDVFPDAVAQVNELLTAEYINS